MRVNVRNEGKLSKSEENRCLKTDYRGKVRGDLDSKISQAKKREAKDKS